MTVQNVRCATGRVLEPGSYSVFLSHITLDSRFFFVFFLFVFCIARGVWFDVCVGTDFVALTRERVLHSTRIEVIVCDRQYVKIQLPAVLFLPYPGLPQELFSC